jgi:serine/threonine protein kinase
MSIQNNVIGPLSAQGISDPYGAIRNFEVIKKLGHGHFSVVYSAKNRFNGVNVALKKVELSQMADAKAIEDCKREISLLQV